jgi:hypothetical protein
MDPIKLEVIDQDGAIRETAEAAGIDRSDFLRKGAIGAAGFVSGGVLFSNLVSPAAAQTISSRRRSRRNDVNILNYALTLEYLEAEFYAAAIRNNAFSNEQYRIFGQTVGQHEAAHVTALRRTLGRAAVRRPRFDFGATVTDPAQFAQTAQVLEDTGVAAYAGQGPNILQRAVVVAALGIHSVEARHAGWIRFLNSGGLGDRENLPAPRVIDRPLSQRAVLAAVRETGFIES